MLKTYIIGAKEIMLKKLYSYQKLGVKFLVNKKRVLLADEMGLGKTIQSLIACEMLNCNEGVLIVCPNNVKFIWAEEIEKWLKKKDYQVFNSNKSITFENKKYNIINYEGLRLEKFSFLRKKCWSALILDEAHKIKNRKALRTLAVKKNKNKYCFALTGTPMPNYPNELWSILNVLYPKIYTSYWRFFNEYVDYDVHFQLGFKIIKGAKNTNKLKKELQSIMIRRKKSQVLSELPPKTYQNWYAELAEKQRKYYNQMKEEMIVQFSNLEVISAPIVLAQLIRLKQICISPYLLKDKTDVFANSIKLEIISDILQEYKDDKIVIFSQFSKAIDILENLLQAISIQYSKITGDVKDKEHEIKMFHSDLENVNVCIGTIQSMGIGIDLSCANYCFFLDKMWTPADNMQAEDRLHRIGQKKNVTIVSLIAKNTIEEYIEKKLKNKNLMNKEILGDVIKNL